MVTLREKRMRAKLSLVALKHSIPTRGLDVVEMVSRLKRTNLTKRDEETLREVCRFYEVEYDEI